MPLGFFKLNSLRSRLMLLVALAIAPTVLMTLINGWEEHSRAISVAEENLQRLTRLAATNEAQSIENAHQILRDLASVPDLLADKGKCEALLRTILKRNTTFANFGLIQRNGDVTCSAVPSSQPVNLGDRPHFKQAIAERRFIAGNYVFGRVIQKHTINLTYPIIDDDQVVTAVVFAAMDLAKLDAFISGISLPPGSVLTTVDVEGSIISRRPDPQQWFGKKVPENLFKAMKQEPDRALVLTGTDGVERLHAFARIGTPEVSEYALTIGIPSQIITATARHEQLRALVALAATVSMALLAAWFIGDILIVRRVHHLANIANRIASGSLDTRTGMRYRNEEISQLARSLDHMADALQKKQAKQDHAEQELRAADKRKDEFLAMLAHELRNPLAPISAAAQLLKLQHANHPRIAKTSEIIARQVEHMTGLVNDLLDVSRVTRGLVVLVEEPQDIRQVIDSAVEQAAPLIESRGHALTLDLPREPAGVLGDHKRLVQIIVNLLNNAAKYTPEGGAIRLRVSLFPQKVELAVSDNGIGMAPDLVQRVFDLFAQAERTSDRSQGGLGLGLALVKSLVELHRGMVEASSPGLGMGSCFTVCLPRIPFEALKVQRLEGEQPAQIKPVTPLKILIAEDNVDAANALALFLEASGHDILVAHSAGEALKLADTSSPQICLIDIGLPDMNGNELVRHLQLLPQCASAIFIAITGYSQEQGRAAALAAGFDHYFVKPVDTLRLSALLAEISTRR